MSSVSLPDGVYVLGGFDGRSYLKTCEKLDSMYFNQCNYNQYSFNFV